MTLQEFNRKMKSLTTKEEREKFLSSLSDEEREKLIKDNIEEQAFINNMFYGDELDYYTEDEDEIEKRIELIKEAINGYDQSELDYTKESVLNLPKFLRIIAHTIPNKDYFSERLFNTLVRMYNRLIIPFNYDREQAFKTLELYDGKIIEMDREGFYQVDNHILEKVLNDNDLEVSDRETREFIQDEIYNTWENQKELLTQDNLNKYSEKRNGINFKHFIFCEEYLKRGKIKPTCEHLGISRNTAYTWLKDKKVQEYLTSRQDEIKEETNNTFLNTYRECFNVLNEMITGNNLYNSDKIKAIDTFLRHYTNIERIKQPSTTYED